MTTKHSLVVLGEHTGTFDALLTDIQTAFPQLEVSDNIASVSAASHPSRVAGGTREQFILFLPGAEMLKLLNTQAIRAARTSGASLLALIDADTRPDVFALGASGISVFVSLSEGIHELLRGVERALRHETYLSPAIKKLLLRPMVTPPVSPCELQVVMLYLADKNWTVDDAASKLHVSPRTVRSHLAALRSNFIAAGFSVRNRPELRQALAETGILTPSKAASAENSPK